MQILHRNPEGWIINSKSVMNALEVLTEKQIQKDCDGYFHVNHVVQVLEEAGADVTEEMTKETKIYKNIIGKNQIRAILNREANFSDSKLKKEGKGWYRI